MFLFKEKIKFSRNFYNNFINNHDGWFRKRNNFVYILKRERRKNDRPGEALSLVLIDLSKYFIGQKKISEREYAVFLKILLNIISHNTRISDIRYFCNQFKIGIILIDTGLEESKYFVDKISRKLIEYFELLDKKEYIHIIQSITISSYLVSKMPNCDKIEATPVLVKNFKIYNNAEINSPEATLQ